MVYSQLIFDKSLDVKDFDISFARGLSFEDGCATITNFTAYLIAKGIEHANGKNDKPIKYLVCGGGRKNKYLIEKIKKNTLKRVITWYIIFLLCSRSVEQSF